MAGREERGTNGREALARALRWVVAAMACMAAVSALAAEGEQHVRGVVSEVAGDSVTVKLQDGRPQPLKLGPKSRVSTATRADLGAIAKGAYVGTTAVQAKDGTLRAVEVHVFPEAARGTGEGHRPWDLKPGSSMTNATVAGAEDAKGARSTMTNANVSDVSGGSGGKRLELTYAGGKQTVIVPPGTPVVRIEPADRAAIATGAHVFAAGAPQPDGTVLVDRMFVGKDGAVPPM
ncbi:hypothetical protein [Anaeromyxobacter dehalogenans]|uniref:Uncharacterized protein n=1 Tax=Anaeromyxobacter dehalogenans (strain 2CP-C) TaxID=290397 RepID=Q2IK99_ANADE|nr:hypothetical protein [Anaeromyxobacter dehalogenans]ABC82080.1 conserved hypothetical protein [Anaeromyxobacter dehalogenans 2CP-C]